jgi:hemerythrin-like domain-containing protein
MIPMHSALAMIQREHQDLAAVLHLLQSLVRDARQAGAAPDFPLLATVLYYIDAFPERYHHPHEEEYLFKRLHEHTPDADTILDDLRAEHAVGPRLIRELERALVHWQAGNQAAAVAFAELAERYVQFLLDHMRKEEEVVFPAAAKALTLADWETIDAAFRAHQDPLFRPQPEQEFGVLYQRIADRVPGRLKDSLTKR